MLRDDQPLTPELKADVFKAFHEHLGRVGKSQEWAARSMAISPAVLNAVLNDAYNADAEPHVRAISKWLASQFLKEHAPRPNNFVKTRVAEQIYGAARFAVLNNAMALVHGPAGVGKSITALAIRAETPGAIFVSINTAGITKKAVMEQIARAIRIPGQSSVTSQLFNQIVDRLRDTGRLLIVDEVHKLWGKRKDEALHMLRDLHDAAGIPILMFGMTNIATYIQTGKAEGNEPLDQLHSRIRLWLNISEIVNCEDGGPGLATVEDIQKMIAASKVKSPFTRDAIGYLRALACEYGEGGFRTVDTLIRLADAVAKGEPVNAEKLRGIQRSRMGIRRAQEIENNMELRIAVA